MNKYPEDVQTKFRQLLEDIFEKYLSICYMLDTLTITK